MAGIVVLAGLVNLVELLCTAGFQALYTQILTLQQMLSWEYYGYLGLYNLAYIFDDSLMVMIAVVTLSRRKLQERAGRWLKLVSGIVMVVLGGLLLMKPDWLRSPFHPCRGKECTMLEDSTRLQLARLASTGSREYSQANPWKVASLG